MFLESGKISGKGTDDLIKFYIPSTRSSGNSRVERPAEHQLVVVDVEETNCGKGTFCGSKIVAQILQ